MEQYIIMAEIIKQLVEYVGVWWIPATVTLWKLPEIISAIRWW